MADTTTLTNQAIKGLKMLTALPPFSEEEVDHAKTIISGHPIKSLTVRSNKFTKTGVKEENLLKMCELIIAQQLNAGNTVGTAEFNKLKTEQAEKLHLAIRTHYQTAELVDDSADDDLFDFCMMDSSFGMYIGKLNTVAYFKNGMKYYDLAGVTFYKAYQLGNKKVIEHVTKKRLFGIVKKKKIREREVPFRIEVHGRDNVEKALESLMLKEAHERWSAIAHDEL